MYIFKIVLCILGDEEDTMEDFSHLNLFNFIIMLLLRVMVCFDILRIFGGVPVTKTKVLNH